VTVQPLDGGLASPGEPLRGLPAVFGRAAILDAGRLQAKFLNETAGRTLAGGRLLALTLTQRCGGLTDLGEIE
jgi:hypothetical protein